MFFILVLDGRAWAGKGWRIIASSVQFAIPRIGSPPSSRSSFPPSSTFFIRVRWRLKALVLDQWLSECLGGLGCG